MTSNQNLAGQWVGFSQLSDGSQGLSIVNIESRSPGTAQLVGVSMESNIRTSSTGKLSITGDIVSGTTDSYEFFDSENDLFVPLASAYNKFGIKTKPPTKNKNPGKMSEHG